MSSNFEVKVGGCTFPSFKSCILTGPKQSVSQHCYTQELAKAQEIGLHNLKHVLQGGSHRKHRQLTAQCGLWTGQKQSSLANCTSAFALLLCYGWQFSKFCKEIVLLMALFHVSICCWHYWWLLWFHYASDQSYRSLNDGCDPQYVGIHLFFKKNMLLVLHLVTYIQLHT